MTHFKNFAIGYDHTHSLPVILHWKIAAKETIINVYHGTPGIHNRSRNKIAACFAEERRIVAAVKAHDPIFGPFGEEDDLHPFLHKFSINGDGLRPAHIHSTVTAKRDLASDGVVYKVSAETFKDWLKQPAMRSGHHVLEILASTRLIATQQQPVP